VADIKMPSNEAFDAYDAFYAENRRKLNGDEYTRAELFGAGYDAALSASEPPAFSAGIIGYLLGLVRYDIRRHQKSIDGFAARHGQAPGEASEVLEHFIKQQDFRYDVHRQLREAVSHVE
jgi:hypothetical protein